MALFVVHATKKLLGRLRPATLVDPATPSTTMLGSWYATVLFWRPQMALLVNEAIAPAAALLDRFPAELASVLAAHGVGEDVIASELAAMYRFELANSKTVAELALRGSVKRAGDGNRTRVLSLGS